MQGDTGLLLGSRPGLQETLAGHLFARCATFAARSYERRSVYFSGPSPQTRRPGDTGARGRDGYFSIVAPVSSTVAVI